MSVLAGEARTYFGDSLEALLPRIREELGPDAVIVRRREGIVGGIGGFFGRRCVEVEARPAPAPAPSPALPARAVLDAYDSAAAPNGAAGVEAATFEEELAQVLAAADEARHDAGAPAELRDELAAAALPPRLVDDLLAEVERHRRPFAPGAPERVLARQALAARLRTACGFRSRRRTIAVVGLAGSGRTLAAASLCAAWAAAGRSVAALSLEPLRAALPLADALRDRPEIRLELADAPALVERAAAELRGADVVVADTPPLADPADGSRLASTLALLEALRPDETHLVLPAGVGAAEGRAVVEALAPHRLPSRLIVSRTDEPGAGGVPVGLALAARIPVSFAGCGGELGRLRPAEPGALARLVLP